MLVENYYAVGVWESYVIKFQSVGIIEKQVDMLVEGIINSFKRKVKICSDIRHISFHYRILKKPVK